MGFQKSGGVKYFVFESFLKAGLPHGMFARHGGVSPEPWNSLNLGGTVGDPRPNVIENRRRIFEAINRPVESQFDVWQVHSADIICTSSPRPFEEPHQKADAILTNRSEITLFMRFADCVPVFLYDPCQKVVGMVHAGWKGTVSKIAGLTVEKMQSVYGCQPGDILAGIGPSIGPDHYEVGEDVSGQVKIAFGEQTSELLHQKNGRNIFDLWTANRLVLEQKGVEQIEISGICTACATADWFSHRGDQGKTGRYGALLALGG